MLKPRAMVPPDEGNEKKAKPRERVVNPRFQARAIRIANELAGPAQAKFAQGTKSGKLKAGSKEYKRAEKAYKAERDKKVTTFFDVKHKKGLSYSKKEQRSNEKKIAKSIQALGKGNVGRRNKAFVKALMNEVPASVKKMVGEAGYARLQKLATRTGKGAKGGGKKNKTGRYAVVGGRNVTEVSGKTSKTVKMGALKQGYGKKGEPKQAKGVQKGKTQYDTAFRGEGGNPRAKGAVPKTGKGEKKAPAKKGAAEKPAKAAKAETPKAKKEKPAAHKKEKPAAPKKGEQAAPAKKEETPKVRITPEAQRLMDAAAARRAGQGQAKPKPAEKPKPAAKPAAKPANDDAFFGRTAEVEAPKGALRTSSITGSNAPKAAPKATPIKLETPNFNNTSRGNTSQTRKKGLETQLRNYKKLDAADRSGKPMTESDRRTLSFLRRVRTDFEAELKNTKWQKK